MNPVMAYRCALESGANCPPESLQPLYEPPLNARVAPRPRAEWGRQLAEQGDTRPGVGLLLDGLPDFDWVNLPSGTFELGGDKDASKPLEAYIANLESFAIARYPVTYAQYAAFVDSDGYTNHNYWTEMGWKWKGDKTQPHDWNDPQHHIGNHPAVGMTFYEAVAFCHWASAKLGYEIRLPTELEWERAARGREKRMFPYGNEFDPTKANTYESGIGRTSAVGIFPQGATPEGIYDLSGNVWEWTLTEWVDINNNTIEGNLRRTVRGGSWRGNPREARSASRIDRGSFLRSSHRGFRVICNILPTISSAGDSKSLSVR